MKTVQLTSEYDRNKKRELMTFRVITLAEVISWAKPMPQPCNYCQSTGQLVSLLDTGYNGPCGACNGTGRRSVDSTPSHIWFRAIDGTARQCKVNGRVKIWKRDTERVEVPVKYGLYEYSTFYTSDIQDGRLLMPMGGPSYEK